MSRTLAHAREAYAGFLRKQEIAPGEFAFSANDRGASPFALCFAIFGYRLLKMDDEIAIRRMDWDARLRTSLDTYRHERQRARGDAGLAADKPFLQLLAFTLSAQKTIGTLKPDDYRELILSLIPESVTRHLESVGADRGMDRSGNFAMFLAILLLDARDRLGVRTDEKIDEWLQFHKSHRNRLGFWGDPARPLYFQFQNGYHQYEILHYLKRLPPEMEAVSAAVAKLADPRGHFAPFPGGGGCYDYDAVSLIALSPLRLQHAELLARVEHTLLEEQGGSGGFGDNVRLRPWSRVLLELFSFLPNSDPKVMYWRIRYSIRHLRPLHSRLKNQWSGGYGRGEENLWDAWFRMLTLAVIDRALRGDQAMGWGFIDYPGIGYPPLGSA
jgi:hypothetical protein